VATGMRARLASSSTIDQASSPLCGPANFWRTIVACGRPGG
jgi:hypothetical protein